MSIQSAYSHGVPVRPAEHAAARGRERRGIFAGVLATLPRSSLTYPLYVVSVLPIVDFKRVRMSSWTQLILLLTAASTAVLLAPGWGQASTAAFVLEIALMFSTLLFACGFSVIAELDTLLPVLRTANLIIIVTDVLQVGRHGIPYAGTTPDILSGLFGSGGARIATVLGFFGLLQEWGLARSGHKWSRRAVAIAAFNFLAPSYVIAIMCGLVALGVWYANSPKRLTILLILAAPSLWYALIYRLNRVSNTATLLMGQSPKHFAYTSVWRLFNDHPFLAFLGTGPGQFSSTPQTWVDEGIRAVGKQGVAHVPGLAVSGYHTIYVFPYTQLGLTHPYAISSAANKPYTGLSSLLAEWGLVGIVLLVMIIRRAAVTARLNSMMWPALAFFLLANTIDEWQDSPWLGLGLLVIAGLSEALAKAPPPKPGAA